MVSMSSRSVNTSTYRKENSRCRTSTPRRQEMGLQVKGRSDTYSGIGTSHDRCPGTGLDATNEHAFHQCVGS